MAAPVVPAGLLASTVLDAGQIADNLLDPGRTGGAVHAAYRQGLGDLFIRGRGDQLETEVIDTGGDVGKRHDRR